MKGLTDLAVEKMTTAKQWAVAVELTNVHQLVDVVVFDAAGFAVVVVEAAVIEDGNGEAAVPYLQSEMAVVVVVELCPRETQVVDLAAVAT